MDMDEAEEYADDQDASELEGMTDEEDLDDREMVIDNNDNSEAHKFPENPSEYSKKPLRKKILGTRKPFRCSICNYITNVKARFTKHVKYHSMPLIKCDFCDFKTPYKWNLDRHLKNHSGEGSLACPLCNFKCDIKQSLTVHVQNHHATLPDNIGELIKQTLGYGESLTSEMDRCESDSGEFPLDSFRTASERKSSALMRRNSSSPVGKRRSLMKLGLTKVLPKRLTSPDFVNKSDKLFVNKFKCQFCNFKTPRQGDLNRHINRCHQFRLKNLQSSILTSPSKPLPCLIPIKSQKTKALLTNESQLSCTGNFNKMIKQNEDNQRSSTTDQEQKVDENTSDSFEEKSAFLEYFALKPVPNSVQFENINDGINPAKNGLNMKESAGRRLSGTFKSSAPRRRTSFFEKLTQKLVANSKSDEGSQVGSSLNSITITSNSTRCQYCRHRCKTSVDLITHLGKCPEARRSLQNPKDEVNEKDSGKNKVFVWNSAPNEYERDHNERDDLKLTDVGQDYDITGYETSPGIGAVHHHLDGFSDEVDQGNSVTTSRKVYKCPQQNCGFWATTASRFHVHIVGHYNLKPFECSQCSYRSNWRWDITKHIRLKSLRDTAHTRAKVLLTHESGQRNYRKYDRYLVGMDLKYSADSKLPDCSTVASKRGDVEFNPPSVVSTPKTSPNLSALQSKVLSTLKIKMPKLTKAPVSRALILETLMKDEETSGPVGPPPILRPISVSPSNNIRTFVEAKMLAGGEISMGASGTEVSIPPPGRKAESVSTSVIISPLVQKGDNAAKKPVWKCKKCPFKHPNKEVVLIHLHQSHKPKKGEAVSILNKNNLTAVGDDAVESHGEGGKDIDTQSLLLIQPNQYAYEEAKGLFKCKFCPFFTTTLNVIEEHLESHSGRNSSHFSCAYCSSIMSSRRELLQHMKVHGSDQIADDHTTANFDGLISPEETPPKPRGSSTNGGPTYKKYHCIECPYVTDSKGQFLYHKQFHTSRDAPFKCNCCSYNVSHKHLLHQHLRVHGPGPRLIKKEMSDEYEDESYDDIRGNEEEQGESSRPTVLVWKNGRPFRMFRCQICPQAFGKLSDLSEHERNHNQEATPCPEAINLSTKNNSKSIFKKGEVMARRESLLIAPQPLDFVSPPQPKSVLYVCDECPARFFYEKELKIHHTFHVKTSDFKCRLCSYSARQQTPHLMSHMKVHGREYQIKTEMLLSKYPKAPPIDFDSSVFRTPISITPTRSGALSILPKGDLLKPDASIQCKMCPAKFNTSASFQHHFKNHGRLTAYTCRHCDFGADILNNLTLHEILHAGSEITIEPDHVFGLPTPSTSSLAISNSSSIEAEPNVVEHPGDLNEGAYLGNPEFIYPTYIKNGRVKSKRYKCSKCPSAFEKRDQYKVHTGLHGSDQRYKCTVCDYAVTYYANFIQHLKKHSNQPNVPPELLIVKPLSKLRNEASQALAISKLPKTKKLTTNPEGENLKRAIKCGRCPYTTCNTKFFEEHISHHASGNGRSDLQASEKCPFCNFAVSKPNLLKDHIRLHFHVSKKTDSVPETHMFIEDIEISVKKGDKSETKLYCEKENYDNKSRNEVHTKQSDSITIVDLRCGLPVSFLNRDQDQTDEQYSEPE